MKSRKTDAGIIRTPQRPLSLSWWDRVIDQGLFPEKDQLAKALKDNPGQPLPDSFREYLIALLEKGKPRGRRTKSKAALDFTYGDAAARYYEVLPRFERTADRTKESPSIRAATFVIHEMKDDFGTIDARTFLNKLSQAGWLRRSK
jgi:hypothetical protein